MNEKIAILKEKIVNPQDFFKDAVKVFRKKIKIERLHFLMPDEKTGDFVTKYTTSGGSICLTKKELQILGDGGQKPIIFPAIEFKRFDCSIIKWSILAKVRWKIWFYHIHAVMPIYFDCRIICLILFRDRGCNNWPDKNYHYLKRLKPEIEYYLTSILLYNQALERVIRQYEGLEECS